MSKLMVSRGALVSTSSLPTVHDWNRGRQTLASLSWLLLKSSCQDSGAFCRGSSQSSAWGHPHSAPPSEYPCSSCCAG